MTFNRQRHINRRRWNKQKIEKRSNYTECVLHIIRIDSFSSTERIIIQFPCISSSKNSSINTSHRSQIADHHQSHATWDFISLKHIYIYISAPRAKRVYNRPQHCALCSNIQISSIFFPSLDTACCPLKLNFLLFRFCINFFYHKSIWINLNVIPINEKNNAHKTHGTKTHTQMPYR